ncbi:hypothetical protein HFO18_14460 [Rhizobium laguerreae]|nr:hypothetical protein [Rhizobium laguerreae]
MTQSSTLARAQEADAEDPGTDEGMEAGERSLSADIAIENARLSQFQ